MATQTYYLKGGPCGGKTGTLTPNQPAPAEIDCGGGKYTESSPAQRRNGALVYDFAGMLSPSGGGGQAPHTHSGWARLQHSVNVNMPHNLNRSQRNNRAALRALAKARKVRL